MRQRSKTNSHPGEDLTLRQRYAKENQACELGWWFPNRFMILGATETHHIMTGRYDLKSNLLRVSMPAHRWLEDYKFDGRVLALFIKHEKGELDPEEFEKASGSLLPGWLLRTREPRNEWIRPLLAKLRKRYP